MAIRVPVAEPRTRPSRQGLGYYQASPIDATGLARGINDVGNEFAARAEYQDRETARTQAQRDRETEQTTAIADKAEASIQRFDALRKLQDFQSGIELDVDTFKREMDPKDPAFGGRVSEYFHKKENEFLGGLPIELQDEFSFRTNQIAQGLAGNVQQYQAQVQDEFFKQGLNQSAELFKSSFAQNPSDENFDVMTAKMGELVNATTLPEYQKQLLTEQAKHDFAAISYRSKIATGATAIYDAAGTPGEASGALASAAKELGIEPIDLATVISYETGGTFSTSVKGGKGGNYTGLIQFGTEEAKKYGVKPGQSVAEQMKSVVAYLKDRGFKPGMSITDLYSTINAGAPGHRAASDGVNTIEGHVATMLKEHQKNAQAFLGGQYQPDGLDLDPMYDSLSYAEKQNLRADGLKEANERYTAEQKARKEQTAEFENKMNIGFLEGKYGQHDFQEAIDAGYYSDYDARKKAQTIIETVNEKAISARNFTAALSGQNSFDPSNADLNKSYNDWVGPEGLAQLQSMSQAYVNNTLQPAVDKTKIIPTDVTGLLSGMARSNDPKKQAFALNTLANFEDTSPQAYDKVPANVQSDVNLWKRWKDVLPQDELFMEINGGYNAEQRAAKKVYRDEAEKVYTDEKSNAYMTTESLLKVFDPGIFSSTPGLANSAFAGKALQADYQETFLHEYVRHNGNVEAAKESALQQMKTRWSTSEFGGTSTLMKNAPEKRYPSVLGSWDWLEKQARSEPQIAAQIGPTDKLQLISDQQTQREMDSGQSPSYMMVRTDAYGTPHEITFGDKRQLWRQAFALPPELAYANEVDFQIKDLEQKLYTFHYGDDKAVPEVRRAERKNMQLRLEALRGELTKFEPSYTPPAPTSARGVRALP